MSYGRLLDIGFGFLQGGAVVAIWTGTDFPGLVLLALATVVGIIGMQRGKKATSSETATKARISETPDEDPRGGDTDA